MNRKLILPLVLVVALTGGLAAGRAMALPTAGDAPVGHAVEHLQRHSDHPMQRRGDHHLQRRGERLALMASILDLTPAQKTQIRQIVKAERKTMRPWLEQIRHSRQQLRRATANGAFNEPRVRKLAASEEQARTELLVSRERVKSRIYALLTPAQQQLAKKLRRLMIEERGHLPMGMGI